MSALLDTPFANHQLEGPIDVDPARLHWQEPTELTDFRYTDSFYWPLAQAQWAGRLVIFGVTRHQRRYRPVVWIDGFGADGPAPTPGQENRLLAGLGADRYGRLEYRPAGISREWWRDAADIDIEHGG